MTHSASPYELLKQLEFDTLNRFPPFAALSWWKRAKARMTGDFYTYTVEQKIDDRRKVVVHAVLCLVDGQRYFVRFGAL